VSAEAEAPEDEAPLTVGELVGLVSGTFEREYAHLLVVGELTSVHRAASGHVYFTLSDASSSIDGVMWRGDALRLAFLPRPGDEVLVRGRMGVFARNGRMQLYAAAMKPVGAGAAQRAFEALRKKLADEGLFAAERKRPLPLLPSVIGVVTSRTGAVLHDILVTLRRRFPGVRVVLAPAIVQGEGAPRSIVAALGRLATSGLCDVVVVGRGGGSAEDLAAFHDEAVVRAVASFPVPVVSAVGHEVDVSLCDLAADFRAATPTAAAEAMVPVRADLLAEVDTAVHRLRTAMHRRLAALRLGVDAAGGRLRHPAARVAELRQRADRVADRLEKTLRLRTERSARRLAALASALDALSPLAVLQRGYSLAASPGGRVVRDAAQLTVGERIELRFRRGRAGADVVWIEAEGPEEN
jgi:exodeoxyribonuclease VII large subunit